MTGGGGGGHSVGRAAPGQGRDAAGFGRPCSDHRSTAISPARRAIVGLLAASPASELLPPAMATQSCCIRSTALRPARAQRCRVAASAAAAAPRPEAGGSGAELSRRQLLSAVTAAGLVAVAGAPAGGSLTAPLPAEALELAPLGRVERIGGDKMVGLSAQQVAVSRARGGAVGSCPQAVAAGGSRTHPRACCLLL